MNDRLKVSFVENRPTTVLPAKKSRRQEIQASMERLWLRNPDQFNPERDCLQRQRIQRTLEALKNRMQLEGKRAVDLGCAAGTFSRLLRDAGAKVDAVDVATNALERLKESDMHDITAIHDCLPTTKLDDNAYDIIVCTELISYLHPNEYRLLFAELARLIKADGIMVFSTALDTETEDPIDRLVMLAETEFIVDQWILSYHSLYLKLCHFFEAPGNFVKASQDKELRQQELYSRRSLSRRWFQLNSSAVMATAWRLIACITSPLGRMVRQSQWIMDRLEKICRCISSQSGISQAIFVGRRRPLNFPLPPDKIPKEVKHKREVWE